MLLAERTCFSTNVSLSTLSLPSITIYPFQSCENKGFHLKCTPSIKECLPISTELQQNQRKVVFFRRQKRFTGELLCDPNSWENKGFVEPLGFFESVFFFIQYSVEMFPHWSQCFFILGMVFERFVVICRPYDTQQLLSKRRRVIGHSTLLAVSLILPLLGLLDIFLSSDENVRLKRSPKKKNTTKTWLIRNTFWSYNPKLGGLWDSKFYEGNIMRDGSYLWVEKLIGFSIICSTKKTFMFKQVRFAQRTCFLFWKFLKRVANSLSYYEKTYKNVWKIKQEASDRAH